MNIKRTASDLINSLKEQHGFLKKSCELYDDGSENEAKRIALCLRILLHDTKKSQSILEQLSIKQTTKFLDTAHTYNENNLMSSSCLTGMRFISNGENCSASVYPLLEKYKNFHVQPAYKDFSTWWDAVIMDDRTQKFSRKDIILSVADTDGGAHVDPVIPKEYHNLTRNNSMEWMLCVNGIEKPVKDFCFASIRQIGFEVNLILDELNIDLWRYQ